jgi:pyruvate kinase
MAMKIPARSTDRARTKIVATVGPASRAPDMLARLVRAGVDVFRLNTAHGTPEERATIVTDIRRINEESQRPVGILVDLAGPKIRLGKLYVEPLACTLGTQLRIVRGEEALRPDHLVTTYDRLVDELTAGDRVMLADGTVTLLAIEKGDDYVLCQVVSEGTIRSRQGVNLPGAKLTAAALTREDETAARWCVEHDVDYVGMSFVRSADDVRGLRELLDSHGSRAKVIAKIEKPEALEHLEAIVEAADGVMVARGDLGVEIDVARMPVVQKEIVATCNRLGKPVIVATQMLDSMQHSRHPTRAEATDVANAVLDGADACMLSGETAIGQHPRESVEMMNRIVLATEESLRGAPGGTAGPVAVRGVHPITSAVVFGSARIAERLDARLVVIMTRSGATALAKAKQRDFIPTVGLSPDETTLRQLSLFWGIVPLRGAPIADVAELWRFIEEWGKRDGLLSPGDRVVLVAGNLGQPGSHNTLLVHEVT